MRLAGAASLRPRPGCYSQLRSSAAAKEGPSSSPRLIAPRSSWEAESASEGSSVTFFCCGDFMTGRGVDQILPFRSDPQIYEKHMKDARGYVRNAEQVGERNSHFFPLSLTVQKSLPAGCNISRRTVRCFLAVDHSSTYGVTPSPYCSRG